MALSLNKNRISVALVCVVGVALLAGCSEPPKTEATPPASTSTASGAGPQRQTLSNNGPSAAPGASNGTLRRIGNK